MRTNVTSFAVALCVLPIIIYVMWAHTQPHTALPCYVREPSGHVHACGFKE